MNWRCQHQLCGYIVEPVLVAYSKSRLHRLAVATQFTDPLHCRAEAESYKWSPNSGKVDAWTVSDHIHVKISVTSQDT